MARPFVLAVRWAALICLAVRLGIFESQVFTSYEGKLVSLKDTVRLFREILSGMYDNLLESTFYMAGMIEDIEAKD